MIALDVIKDHKIMPLVKAPCLKALPGPLQQELNFEARYSRQRSAASRLGKSDPYIQRHCVLNFNLVTVQLEADFRKL